jgi:hypothetical protein
MATKVQVTMTVEQARVMMRAMDLYMRLLMGQFEELEHLFFAEENDPIFERSSDHLARADLEYYLKRVKKHVYPTLENGQYWGITGRPCPERATMAYDMYKTMDHAISWYQNPKGDWTVNYDKPMHWYKKMPLPEVKVYENGQL